MQPKQKDRLQSTEAFMRLKATQESQNLKENEAEEDSETVVVNKNIDPNPINAEITTRVTPLPKKRYANQRNLFINLWLIFLFILTCFTEINVAWISIGYFDLIFTSLFIALFPFCYYITGLYQLYFKNQKAGFWMIGSGTMIVLCFIFSVAAEWLTPDGRQGADISHKIGFYANRNQVWNSSRIHLPVLILSDIIIEEKWSLYVGAIRGWKRMDE